MRGYSPNERAGPAASTSARVVAGISRRSPSDSTSGTRSSMPGSPIGVSRKLDSGGAAGSRRCEWSEPTVSTVPSRIASQSASTSAAGAERRADDEARRVGPRVGALVEQEVVRADLDVDLRAARTGRACELDRDRRREVHEIRGRAGQRGDRDRPLDGLVLDGARPRARVVAERRLAGGDQVGGQRIDQRTVLALHLHRDAERGGVAQHPVELSVVEHEAELGKREEDLDAADALAPEPLEQLDADIARVEVAAVHADIDDGAGHAGVACPHERVERRLPRLGQREGEDRRRAAERRPDGDGVQVGQRVRVRIDPARQHEAAAGVERTRYAVGRAGADLRDHVPRARRGRPRRCRRA